MADFLDYLYFIRLSFTEAKWRIADFQAEIRLLGHFMQIRINYTIFRRPRGKETYCRDETDPILLTGVSDSVADYEIGEMAKWRMAAPGKTACYASCNSTLLCVM